MRRSGLAAIVVFALARSAVAQEDDGGTDASEPDATEVDAGVQPDVTVQPIQPVFEASEYPESTPPAPIVPAGPVRRQAGELVLLYVVSIQWGGTLSLFIDAMAQSGNAYAGVTAAGGLGALATGALGAGLPALIDLAFEKRNGVAQTVATGMLIGLGEGIAWNEYFANRATTSFHTYTKDMAWIFGGETLGLASGLVVAALVPTTPGRAAWVETTGLFGGLFAASVAGAASRASTYNQWDREGNRNAGLAGAIVGLAGTATGIATADLLSPSVLRVHLIDLGWIGGAMIPGLACINHCNPSDSFAAIAVGSGIGFATTFLATAWLPKDLGRGAKPPPAMPYAVPTETGGVEIGFGGTF
jgi:hypothetical protein